VRDLELDRRQFEALIEPDLRRTMEAVNRALKDAQMLPSAIDDIILVGGSTRIPMVERMLEEKFGKPPRSHIDPDLCVAMGAGIQAAREMGIEGSGVLVDITPYTFGTSVLGEINGLPSPDMFVPLIRRNTKLPAKRSEVFFTAYDRQEAVDVRIYQGENINAEDNVRLGNYIFQLTPAPAGSEIVLRFDLDLNGILKIRAVEKSRENPSMQPLKTPFRAFPKRNWWKPASVFPASGQLKRSPKPPMMGARLRPTTRCPRPMPRFFAAARR